MDKRKEKLLADRFPEFWDNLYGDRVVTCMAYGFQCGDGWFQLIWNLCEEIEAVLKSDPVTGFKVGQVKEKFGSLRFYVDSGNTRIYHAIRQSEELSETICENCGSHEAHIRHFDGRRMCRCDICWARLKLFEPFIFLQAVQCERVILNYDRLLARLEQ